MSASSARLAVIAGAGVAGLAAAIWLDRIGWRAIVVERAPDLRAGGYVMGLSGPGHEAAKRLGILPDLEAVARDIHENVYRDRRGREIMRLRYREFLPDLPYLVLRRTDLVRVLHDRAAGVADIRLSTTIEGIDDRGDGVTVRLSDGETVEADLVIGADGFRSDIRRRLFEAEDRVVRPLGYRFAVYDLDDHLHLGADFLSYAGPGHLSEYYTLAEGRLAALHVWHSAATGPVAAGDRWPLLLDLAARSHPDVRRIMDAAQAEGPPLIDDLALVEMPSWSKGRVLLMGDSAHCLSLVSGQGAGIAMASAAILADELASGDVDAALARHEQRLRPAAGRLQDRSRKMAAWFIPASPAAFHIRNFVMRHIPRRLLARYFLNTVKSEIAAASGLALEGEERSAALDGCPYGPGRG